MADARPDDHATARALCRDLACQHCGHPGDHRYMPCDGCLCGVVIPAPFIPLDS